MSKTVYDCANPQCKFGGKIYTNKQSAIQLQSCGHKVHIQCMTVGKPCCQCGIKMKWNDFLGILFLIYLYILKIINIFLIMNLKINQ